VGTGSRSNGHHNLCVRGRQQGRPRVAIAGVQVMINWKFVSSDENAKKKKKKKGLGGEGGGDGGS
jgi:hypothetical protein